MSGTSPRTQTLVFLSLKRTVVHIREIVIIRVYFLHPRYFLISCAPVEVAPFDLFFCFMAQKTCFCDSYVLFGVRTNDFNNFHYFFANKRTIPYSRNVKLQSTITPVLRPGSHLGLRSRLDLAPKRLESRLSHHLMTRLDLKFS